MCCVGLLRYTIFTPTAFVKEFFGPPPAYGVVSIMMSQSSLIGLLRRRCFLCYVNLSVLAILSISTQAQMGAIDSDPSQAIGSRLTARNVLQGIVTLPSGARLNGRVKVRITGNTGASLFTMTDDNGAFVFQRLAGGSYFLSVDAGKEYETANELVDIFDPGGRSGRGSTQTVFIQLRYKSTKAEKTGTVNAALAGVPKEALKQYEKALKASQQGDGKKAVEALKNAIKIHPEFMLAHNELGLQYLSLNQLNDALAAFRDALRLAPEDFTPIANYGAALFYAKEYEKAIEQLNLALKKRGDSASARFLLGRSLIKMKRYEEAEKELQQAVQIGGPGINEAYRYLGGLYVEMGDNKRAVEALEKYLSLTPNVKDAAAVRQIVEQLRAQAAKKNE